MPPVVAVCAIPSSLSPSSSFFGGGVAFFPSLSLSLSLAPSLPRQGKCVYSALGQQGSGLFHQTQ